MDKVLAGDIDGAMAQTEALAPGTLTAHPSLLFRLHCQTFLELVRTGNTPAFPKHDSPASSLLFL